jgi:hypothetical protein
MNEPTITCPSCKSHIKLTDSLAAPLIEATRTQFEDKLADFKATLAAKEAHVAGRETALQTQQVAMEAAKAAFEVTVAERIKGERAKIASEEAAKARHIASLELDQKTKELAGLQDVLADRDAKLIEAQKAQVDVIRKGRELDDAHRELELTVEKRIQASLESVRERAKQDAEATLRVKVIEKEEQIASMQRQIEDLRRKAEQGSQQLQGEASELELEGMLRSRFPGDVIEAVGKGEFGGDVMQTVRNSGGQICGMILWESKRTRNWSDGWLAKLRADQRTAKADIAIIVSNALPKGVSAFDCIDDVWVAEHRCALPVALCLRQSLLDIQGARQASEGQQTKMELVYQYLTGPRFKHRVQAIVENFTNMSEDLDRERKIMTKNWAKRQNQIHGVIETTAGLYGDLQGIAGKALVDIDVLNMPMLETKREMAS